VENKAQQIILANNPPKPVITIRQDVVHVMTKDEEMFPVHRRLLRPCISLTAIVQAGYGKYKESSATSGSGFSESSGVPTVSIDVEACTFDRVLLYLQHEDRGEEFKFDPLLAAELLAAAQQLGISGLSECCLKVLGSFKDRVRKSPIRLDEVIHRNSVGTASAQVSNEKKRSDTWLILNGMVLDVSRWLEEHPGGSTIIPEQALNMDCTVFFEIYHASRQSFKYLKEFYIGELSVEDIDHLPVSDQVPSPAFLDELRRHTQWRLKVSELCTPVVGHLGGDRHHIRTGLSESDIIITDIIHTNEK
jgi:cytochrome b involved in lipid metabolism